MRDFIIDLCLVGLFLFMMNSFLNDYGVKKAVFEKEVVTFEEEVKEQKVISTGHGTTNDNSENALSLVVKSISDFCIKIIETIVLIISNFISMLL